MNKVLQENCLKEIVLQSVPINTSRTSQISIALYSTCYTLINGSPCNIVIIKWNLDSPDDWDYYCQDILKEIAI